MAHLVVSAEFVRPGLVGGAEQALKYLLSGLGASLSQGDRLTVVGGGFGALPEVATPLDSPEWLSPRFLRETVSFARFGSKCDAYYFPNYFTPPWPSGCRVVTTIHDQQYRHLPENFTLRKRLWLAAAHRTTLRRADVVTVISEWVREDLMRTYGDRIAHKMTVLPNAVDWTSLESAEEPIADRPFVLSVASHYSHKNLGTLVRAFKRVHDKVPDLQLVLVGQFADRLVGVRKAENIPLLVAELGLDDDVLVTGYISTSELGSLYRHAELFVFPSVFEGFGLPPVEAMGFGVPVITTARTSLPEVTLGLAEYVDDPLDPEELAARIKDAVASGRKLEESVIRMLRDHYAPERIGRRLYELMTSGS